MSNLNSLLASKFLAAKQYKNIVSTDFIIQEEPYKIYFLIEVELLKKNKEGLNQTKFYKQDITKFVNNHGSLENLYKALITSEMLLAGYLLIPIDGGFLCIGGDEVYSINNSGCTCPAYLNNNKELCKHLLFRDGLLDQRARVNNWKINNL